MTPARSRHQSQWAAQFAVASELCKLGYQVAMTMGNHPIIDLMVRSPGGHGFVIDVKGQRVRNPWPVAQKPAQSDLFYVLAFVPLGKPNRFFVLTQAEMNQGLAAYIKHLRNYRASMNRSTEKVGIMPCLPWATAEGFEDSWDKLPK